MSLSKEPTFSLLHNRFVCGYRDISNEPYAGNSGAHSTNANAVETTNGAGPHNIQMFVLDADGTVLHCLPGYWNSEDLSGELHLAEQLDAVWQDHTLSPEQKKRQFSRMQMEHLRQHSRDMVARSQMQGFDRHHELSQAAHTDTIRMASSSNAESWQNGADSLVKTTDEIMHERMSCRPFVAYSNFDTARFADYGTRFYDKHEENLDETGMNINPGAKTITMKEVSLTQRAQSRRGLEGGFAHLPQVQVKTYGRLRREAPQ